MDERELANHVVDQAAYRNAAQRVMTVRIAVGGLRPIDHDRLLASFADASRGTVADGARLLVQVLPVRRHCRNCGHDFDAGAPDRPFPACFHPHTEATTGEEVRVLEIQVDDAA